MPVLIDSSVWIDYFRSGKNSAILEDMIDEGTIVSNDLILAELIPFLQIKKEKEVITLLKMITKMELTIDWAEIIHFQYQCLLQGINKVGIPDLIILQNVMANDLVLFSYDTHFKIMQPVFEFNLICGSERPVDIL